jgi:hypothetical protein
VWNILSVGIGAGLSLIGVDFGSWFTARRQDRMWLRDQKLKAAIHFNTAAGELYDHLRAGGPREDQKRDELRGRMQEGRSALYLLCGAETVDLVEAVARRVLHAGPADRQEEHTTTIELLREHTHQMRRELGAGR